MVYTTKRPIEGFKVLGRQGAGKKLVGVPTKYLRDANLEVLVLSEDLCIRPRGEPLKIERFADKFGRGSYELAYFELANKPAERTA